MRLEDIIHDLSQGRAKRIDVDMMIWSKKYEVTAYIVGKVIRIDLKEKVIEDVK